MLIIPFLLCTSWGFFAHKSINRLAIFALPDEMLSFYKRNHRYLADHAVDADKRRYADPYEAPRHYIDVENYEPDIDSIPEKWKDAVAKYGEQHLRQHGTVPWQIEKVYFNLVKAFKEHDSVRILKHSADLGHYIGDAHVPLHTSRNHDGQLTGQSGLHAFWESRLPELFTHQYRLLNRKAMYFENPLKEAWKIVKRSHLAVDTVIRFEAELNRVFPPDQKYSYAKRGNIVIKQYSDAYAKAYDEMILGMVEKRMRAAILSVASYWYSAWVDAGQPALSRFRPSRLSADEKKQLTLIEKKYRQGKIIGREN